MYDLIVIGAGPAGYVGAIRAAQLGMSVALVERHKSGGTCLQCGCIPTKTLLHESQSCATAREAASLGLTVSGRPDMTAIQARKNQVIEQLTQGIDKLLAANNVTVVQGMARLGAAGQVTVDNQTLGTTGPVSTREQMLTATGQVSAGEQTLTARHVLLATGSRVALPPIPGLSAHGAMDSEQLLNAETLPQSLAILGGGVIGVEMATIFANLGCRVTILEMQPRILPGMAREVSGYIAMGLKKRGVDIITDARVTDIQARVPESRADNPDARVAEVQAYMSEGSRPDNPDVCIADGQAAASGLIVSYSQRDLPAHIEAQSLLVCTGRKANVENLGLEALGVTMENGVVVNASGQSNLPWLYAAGDVTANSAQLAHAASAQAIAAVEHMANSASGQEVHAPQDEVPVPHGEAPMLRDEAIPMPHGETPTPHGKPPTTLQGEAFAPQSEPPAPHHQRPIPQCVYTFTQVASIGQTTPSPDLVSGKFMLGGLGIGAAQNADAGFYMVYAHADTHRVVGAVLVCPHATDIISTVALAIEKGVTLEELHSLIYPHPAFCEGLGEAAGSALSIGIHSTPVRR